MLKHILTFYSDWAGINLYTTKHTLVGQLVFWICRVNECFVSTETPICFLKTASLQIVNSVSSGEQRLY